MTVNIPLKLDGDRVVSVGGAEAAKPTRSEGKHIMGLVERYASPPYDAHTDDMTVPFAIELAEKDSEIDRLRNALTMIASFGGKTLIAPSFGPDYDKGHQAGSHAAFESAADVARAAIAKAEGRS